ncbi:1-acyl-sn-glycerol-3-phosphate acyltransferase [Ulvibacter sp. MAR_2010_11]|uniref:lysophospholipid acyltransferase family protein n=1 Tax=Ulvibacter sp. MAR_2010_11 TaxID=1250229 RepID=UPI000C2C414F|nr:lysophospholipid acyltransferase family protein [Ulvibacter sp. MAR_2010_11]PKA82878.1 1-acyl-sn-glycerol-3-phosphate acyltransferase [Ulvibacter sp. MAR_2010_11]
MNILRYILSFLYRIWFYILLTVPIIVLFPILFISILREEWYPLFFRLARLWATIILFGMGFVPVIYREVTYNKNESYLFVSNHTSMTDIMLMLYLTRNPFVFVGKKELERIPLFGFFYKRTCIMVDRGSPKSRMEVFRQAQRKLSQGLSVCIFPEGGVPEDEDVILDLFKDGAFRLAIEHAIPIAPMTFFDNKKRLPYNFASVSAGPGRLRVRLHPLISTKTLQPEDRKALKMETREIILEALQHPVK